VDGISLRRKIGSPKPRSAARNVPNVPVRFILKHAVRQLAKSPGFTIVSILMLALGIGMSTSTFSITNSVLLSSMPFPNSEELVQIFGTSAQSQMMPHSPANYCDLEESSSSFASVAAFVPDGTNVAEPGHPPEEEFCLTVTANFLPILGVQPFLGRGFTADEDQPSKKDNVAILTYTCWRHRFGADPKILGKTLRVGLDNCTVIGSCPLALTRRRLGQVVRLSCRLPGGQTSRMRGTQNGSAQSHV
jgi:hypothetical protein